VSYELSYANRNLRISHMIICAVLYLQKWKSDIDTRGLLRTCYWCFRYEYVGFNQVEKKDANSVVTADIPECQRIQVKAGDVIGFYHPWTRMHVQIASCKVNEDPGFNHVSRLNWYEDKLAKGTAYQFQDIGCQKISMTAVVGPVRMCSLPSTPAHVVKVSQGDSVPVGQEVVYKCQEGFQLLSGDLRRRCGPCGQLEGAAPTCGGTSVT